MSVASIACATALSFSATAASAPAPLAARLQALAGERAQDCGTVSTHDDRAAALACATRAVAAGTPFRVALQLDDAASRQGAVRDPQGRLWAVFYEMDAEPGTGPTLSALLCRSLTFSTQHGEDAIDCTPTLDMH